MKKRREPPLPQPGDVIASGEVDGVEREFSIQAVRIQPSMNVWEGTAAGSVGSAWVSSGYELCWRPKGEAQWRCSGHRARSVRELLDAMAEDLDLPDKILRHPRAIEIRRELRLEEKREQGWEG